MKIMAISGSLNEFSHTCELCREVLHHLRNRFSCETILWDLRTQKLPFHDPRFHHAPLNELPPKLRNFRKTVRDTDALILATPIYHNSFSGLLKNAIDHLTIEVMQHKPVGLLSHGGNRSPQGVDHLRIVARSLHSISIPTQVCTAKEDYSHINHDKKLSSPEILERIHRFNQELLYYASLFQNIQSRK